MIKIARLRFCVFMPQTRKKNHVVSITVITITQQVLDIPRGDKSFFPKLNITVKHLR